MIYTTSILLLGALSAARATSAGRRDTSGTVQLKIMPQGASITRGSDSSDYNGYRLGLRTLLEADGQSVVYVGSVSWGTMDNNLNEGHPGYTIQAIQDVALSDGAYDYLPNVILLNAGTNDCNIAGNDPGGAPARYSTLLSSIRDHNPDALVVASSLIPNLNEDVDECIRTLNEGIHEAVQNASAAGQKMAWVDMYNVVPKSEINTTDATHPTDYGYQLMAKAWYDELMSSLGQVTAPDPNGKPVPETEPVTSE